MIRKYWGKLWGLIPSLRRKTGVCIEIMPENKAKTSKNALFLLVYLVTPTGLEASLTWGNKKNKEKMIDFIVFFTFFRVGVFLLIKNRGKLWGQNSVQSLLIPDFQHFRYQKIVREIGIRIV